MASRVTLREALAVHGELAKVVAPATPISIETTKPRGETFVGRLVIENPSVRLLVYLTLASLVSFLIGVGLGLAQEAKAEEATGDWLQSIMLLFAAGLGAGFYALITAHRYIVERTFNPQYNQIYLIRFVLGLVAGTILGYFGEKLWGTEATSNSVRELGPLGLALVGGFAADAVAEILRRVAEVLVALVRGGARSQAEAQEAQVRAEEERKRLEKDRDAAKDLTKMAADPSLPDSMRSELEGVIGKLLK